VKVLLDECVDWRLAREIVGHDVSTAHGMGWNTIKNGELLALASKHFDAFITVDRNLRFQQNLTALPFAIIILQGKTTRLADLKPLIPALLSALDSAVSGVATIVGGE
jgi:hypothetical protein